MSALTDVFTNIGNALRSKMGVSTTFRPDQMAPAINNLSGGMTYNIINAQSGEVSPYVIGIKSYNNGLEIGDNNGQHVYDFNNTSIRFNSLSNDRVDVTDGVNSHSYYMPKTKADYYNGKYIRSFDVINTSDNVYQLFKNNISSFDMYPGGICFGSKVVIMGEAFENCTNFNREITIGPNVNNIYCCFLGCNNFNQPIHFSPNLIFGNGFGGGLAFYGCKKFNQPININLQGILTSFFGGCIEFNQPVNIGPVVGSSIDSVFQGCYNLNQPINISSSITAKNMDYTFCDCHNFNQSIIIPPSIQKLSDCFADCWSLNQPIYITGNNITNLDGCFYNCKNFGSNIYLNNLVCTSNDYDTNFTWMFANSDLNKIKRVFVNRNSVLSPGKGILGASKIFDEYSVYPKWTQLEDNNGYYCSNFNYYVYNNGV